MHECKAFDDEVRIQIDPNWLIASAESVKNDVGDKLIPSKQEVNEKTNILKQEKHGHKDSPRKRSLRKLERKNYRIRKYRL